MGILPVPIVVAAKEPKEQPTTNLTLSQLSSQVSQLQMSTDPARQSIGSHTRKSGLGDPDRYLSRQHATVAAGGATLRVVGGSIRIHLQNDGLGAASISSD